MWRRDALIALCALVVACADPAPAEAPAPEADHAQAEAGVRALFAAIARSDCDMLATTLTSVHSRPDCETFVQDQNANQFRLVEILGSATDGRDHSAVIVRTRVSRGGHLRVVLVRANYAEGRWTFAF
jgi:hypothetical protein